MYSAIETLAATEISDGAFLGYVVALAVSGLLLLGVAASGFGTPSIGMRILTGVIGLAMLGYAFYLFFIFDGGEFRMFYYVFIVPIVLLVQAFRTWRARGTEQPAPAGQQPAQQVPAE